MPLGEVMAGRGANEDRGGREGERLKVFISYSRSDVDFADEFEIALERMGFEPIVDRHGIVPGEPWEERLSELLFACDVGVFILTEVSAASAICAWEVEEASRLGKRLLVATLGPLPEDVRPPPGLAGIHWVHCWRNPAVPGSNQTRGFFELGSALRLDHVWLRQRTRLLEQARRYTARAADGGSAAMLLRGEVLQEAVAWAAAAPDDETIPVQVTEFLRASEAHVAELKANADARLAEREAALASAQQAELRLRKTSVLALLVGLALTVLALGGGYLAWHAQEAANRQAAATARQSSVLLALQSKAIADAGRHETALLMALQADPLAQRDRIRREFDGEKGYSLARARLAAAAVNMRLVRVLRGHRGAVRHATFSKDGNRIVTTSDDNTAMIWGHSTSEALVTLVGHEDKIGYAIFSPDGELVATPTWDGNVHLWDSTTGELLHTLTTEGGFVWSTRFSLDSTRIVASSTNGDTARIWDTRTGRLELELLGHKDAVRRVVFSPDGTHIATTSRDHTALLWDATTGDALLTLSGHDAMIWDLAFSPDGTRIATASYDHTVRLWDSSDGEAIRTLSGHRSAVLDVSFSPDSSRIVTRSQDETMRVWSTNSGEVLSTFPGGGLGGFLHSGKSVLTTSRDATVRVRDVTNGDVSLVLAGHEGTFVSAVISPDKTLFLTGSDDGTARLWSATIGEPVLTLSRSGFASDEPAAFSADGSRIVGASGEQGGVEIWDAGTGEVLQTFSVGSGSVSDVVFSPDGGRILVASTDTTARILDAATGNPVLTLRGHEAQLTSASFSSDGRRVATSSWDDSVRVWDASTGNVLHVLRGHKNGVESASFSPDSSRLVTASRTTPHKSGTRGRARRSGHCVVMKT